MLAATMVAGCATALQEGAHGDGSPRESTILLADGTALSATEMGEGPLIVVLHGGPSLGHRYLVDGFRSFSDRHRIVLYDQRGAGRSSDPSEGQFGLQQLVDDLEAVVAQKGGGGVVVVGHSWGAWVAMSYAQRTPAALRGLVLVTPAEPGDRFAERQRARMRDRTTDADSLALATLFQSRAFEEGSEETMDRLFQAMYRPWFGRREAAAGLKAGLTRDQVERARAMGARVSGRAEGGATWSTLGRIDVPVLVLQGEDDVVPPGMARALADSIPDARLEVLQGVGHFPMLEAPEEQREALATFISGLGG